MGSISSFNEGKTKKRRLTNSFYTVLWPANLQHLLIVYFSTEEFNSTGHRSSNENIKIRKKIRGGKRAEEEKRPDNAFTIENWVCLHASAFRHKRALYATTPPKDDLYLPTVFHLGAIVGRKAAHMKGREGQIETFHSFCETFLSMEKRQLILTSHRRRQVAFELATFGGFVFQFGSRRRKKKGCATLILCEIVSIADKKQTSSGRKDAFDGIGFGIRTKVRLRRDANWLRRKSKREKKENFFE